MVWIDTHSNIINPFLSFPFSHGGGKPHVTGILTWLKMVHFILYLVPFSHQKFSKLLKHWMSFHQNFIQFIVPALKFASRGFFLFYDFVVNISFLNFPLGKDSLPGFFYNISFHQVLSQISRIGRVSEFIVDSCQSIYLPAMVVEDNTFTFSQDKCTYYDILMVTS